MTFKSTSKMETEAQEVERLALAPEGSTSHYLSTIPVLIDGPIRGLLIDLPWSNHLTKPVVVVPIEFYSGLADHDLHQRHSGWWRCIVVESSHESYPVGGYDLSISTAELVRGRRLRIER